MTQTITLENGRGHEIDQHPDQCPLCHKSVSPILRLTFYLRTKKEIQIVYSCPNSDCFSFFISYFDASAVNATNKEAIFVNSKPIIPMRRNFESYISDLSPYFCTIYNEAKAAEDTGLKQICGVGYRKALEFLIKDYLIAKPGADATTLKKLQLGGLY
jgi:hypothetical protein